MSWPLDAFLYLRQIVTPNSRPQVGGSLLYVKSDGKPYLLDANGAETNVGGDVTLTGTQTLTNKTLTSPRIGGGILDVNGVTLLGTQATANAVNNLKVVNNGAGLAPQLLAEGADAGININLVPKGAGTVKANGVDVVTTTGTQTLTNKTLTSPTVTTLTLDGVVQKARTRGTVTGTTDASGDLTITHGLGSTPTAVLVTSGYLTAAVVVAAHTIGATTFKVRNWTSTTGAALASTASVIVYWEAIV